MRIAIEVLPPAEFGLTYVKRFDRHRCDVSGIGLSDQTNPAAYRWDNARRPPGLLFQYTLEGQGLFEDVARGKRWTLPPGAAFLVELPSATRYRLPEPQRRRPRWRFIWTMLHGDAALYHGRRLIREHGHVVRLPRSAEPIAALFELHRLVQTTAAEDEQAVDELTMNLHGHRFLLELERSLRSPSQVIPDAIAAAVRLIRRRYADPDLSIEALAAAAGYSRYHFTRLFRQHTGDSPYQALLKQRMRQAVRLLSTTDEPIKRIALQVGFRDVTWFCAAFRRHVRATPAAVRREHRRLHRGELLSG